MGQIMCCDEDELDVVYENWREGIHAKDNKKENKKERVTVLENIVSLELDNEFEFVPLHLWNEL